jgi:hypothetical protein
MSDDPLQLQQYADQPRQEETGSVDRPGLSAGSLLANGNVILLIIAVAGVGVLLVLRSGHAPAAASADQEAVEQQVDTALLQAKALAARRKNTGRSIIERFYYQAEARQVPVEGVEGNPFRFRAPPREVPDPQPEETDAPAPQAETGTTAAARRRALAAVRDLKLQSVMTGSRGRVAMVSNNLLTAGQSIHGWQVVDVGPRSVTLRWRDQIHRLTMRE